MVKWKSEMEKEAETVSHESTCPSGKKAQGFSSHAGDRLSMLREAQKRRMIFIIRREKQKGRGR